MNLLAIIGSPRKGKATDRLAYEKVSQEKNTSPLEKKLLFFLAYGLRTLAHSTHCFETPSFSALCF